MCCPHNATMHRPFALEDHLYSDQGLLTLLRLLFVFLCRSAAQRGVWEGQHVEEDPCAEGRRLCSDWKVKRWIEFHQQQIGSKLSAPGLNEIGSFSIFSFLDIKILFIILLWFHSSWCVCTVVDHFSDSIISSLLYFCSIAILKYMAQRHSSSVPDHWYPAELKQQARVNEYLAWQHTNLRMHGSKIFLLKVRVVTVAWPHAAGRVHSHMTVTDKLSRWYTDLNKWEWPERTHIAGCHAACLWRQVFFFCSPVFFFFCLFSSNICRETVETEEHTETHKTSQANITFPYLSIASSFFNFESVPK